MTLFQMIGILGFISYISCFSAVQLSLVKAPSVRFSLWNLTSASLVLISLSENFNLAAALIQSSWIAISLAALYAQIIRPRLAGRNPMRRDIGSVIVGSLMIMLAMPSETGNDYDAKARFAAARPLAQPAGITDIRIVYAGLVAAN